jgi:hypothetical protein
LNSPDFDRTVVRTTHEERPLRKVLAALRDHECILGASFDPT